MEYFTHALPNGIRLIFLPVQSLIAHAGLFVNTGSRHEKDDEHGMAHFIEHILFKGTKKRKAYHILTRLEDVGGELNAYTTKEDTCIHASFLKEDLERALELIGDIAFNSTFPEKELEKEKEVIIDEINSYLDNPSELIFDDFDEMLFPNHPLGRSILGKPETLKTISRKHVFRFIASNYNTNKMVLCVAGNLKFDQLCRIFEKHYGHVPANSHKALMPNLPQYLPKRLELERKTYQTHCIIGTRAYNYTDNHRLTLHMLTNIIGGPGMNSRLNLSLRERHGCTYNIDASYNPFSDTGIFSIYFGTDKENLKKSEKLVYIELRKLMESPLSDVQLRKAKKQIIGQLAIASEHNENLMISIGKSYLVYDKVDTLEEIYRQIEAITAIQLQEVANDILNANGFTTIVYK